MPPLSPSVTVTTGARLHFGLLVRGEPDRRTYGGMGLMIDQPHCSLTVRSAVVDHFTASAATAERLREFLLRWRMTEQTPPCDITIHEEIPPHAGLGSGTQWALALAAALRRKQHRHDVDITELAMLTGRGRRSAIGTVGFTAGGLILDEGRPVGDAMKTNTTRHEFPAEWRFVLITPTAQQGLSGDSERLAFQQLPPMNDGLLSRLAQIMHQLPADAARRDFPASCEALWEFGQRVGEYFSPMQGGVFASSVMAETAIRLRTRGITGVGQSSWGPTIFVLCDGMEMAESVASMMNLWESWTCHTRIVAPLNHGAIIHAG